VSLDFTAIDFETASGQPGSACSVGLVRVRDGQVVHKSGGLIRPPAGLGEFALWNTSVHGITAEMVATAPAWRKVAAWIVQYAGADTLICHNANFNIGVLRHACTADDIPWPRVDFLCTMILARWAFRLPSYRLPFVAAECGVELAGRHQVLINARGAARPLPAHREVPPEPQRPGPPDRAGRQPGRGPGPPAVRAGDRVHRGSEDQDPAAGMG
jgi:DNA polymerase III epsilon subunit-like protein